MKKIFLSLCLIGLFFFMASCGIFRKSVKGPEMEKKEVLTSKDVEVPQTSLKEKDWDQLTNEEKKKRNKAVELANQGNNYLKEGNYKQAIRDFQSALKEWPDLSDASLGLGNAFYKDGQYSKAIESMDNYLHYNAKKADPYFIKGLCLRKLGDNENSLKNFLLVTKINDKDALAFLEIANIYFEESAFSDALGNYEKAKTIDQNLVEAFLGMGQVYIKQKEFDQALKVLGEGIKIKEDTRLVNLRNMAQGLLFLKKGQELFQDQKYKEAIEKFKETENLVPDNYELNFLTGQAYLKMGQQEQAEPYLVKAYKIKADDVDLYLVLVDINLKKKAYQEAVRYLKEAQEKWPENYKVRNLMGMVYNETESYTKAIESFLASLRLKPDYAEAHLNLGFAYYEMEKYKEAKDSFDKAYQLNSQLEKALESSRKSEAMLLVQEGNKVFEEKNYMAAIEKYNAAVLIEPDFLEILVNLGNAYVETGDYSQAILHYKKALEKDKNYLPALFGLERAYRNNNDISSAQKINEQLSKLKGRDASQFYKMGLTLEANKKFDDAIEEYKKALLADPTFKVAKNRIAKAYYKKGVFLFNDKKFNEAKNEFSNALRYNPSFFDAQDKLDYMEALRYINEASQSYDEGNNEKAIESYQNALRIYKGVKEVYLNLANIYIIKKDFKKAENVLREGISNFPQAADYYQMLGLIYMVQTDYKTAYSYYSKSLEMEPKNDSVLNDIGEIFIKNEDYDQAQNFFSQAISINPKNFSAHINLGITYFKKGDYQKAAAEFEATKKLDDTYDPAYFNCGLAYFKLNDYVKSEYNFKYALRLKEDVPPFYFYLARTLYLMPGKIDEAITHIEKALTMQKSPLYFYGAGKIYEQKIIQALKMDVPKYLEKAIDAYKQVISMVPGTQLAQWAQERLIALVPDVRLMSIYPLTAPTSSAVDYQKGFLAAGDDDGIVYLIDTQDRSMDMMKKKLVLGIPITSDVKFHEKSIFVGLMNGEFICFDSDLNKVWTFQAESQVVGSPGFDRENVYFGTGDGKIYGLRMDSGRRLWSFSSGSSLAGSMVVDKNDLFFNTADGEIFDLDTSGNVKWRFEALGNSAGGVSLCKDYVGAGTDRGLFYMLDRFTGKVLKKLKVEMPIESGVFSDKYNFYFGAGNILYSVFPEGKVNWKFVVNSKIRSLPDIKENLIVFSEESGTVYAVFSDTGKQKWKYTWSGTICSRPVIVSKNNTYISAANGSILELYYK